MNALQEKQLNILKYFIKVCEKHNLQYFLVGGSTLGAIRHKGFIPWDDDIDVGMPREDYDKLVGLWDKYADKSRFRCERTDENRSVMFPMTVVRSVNTTCIYDHSVNKSDICQGLKKGLTNRKRCCIIHHVNGGIAQLVRAHGSHP